MELINLTGEDITLVGSFKKKIVYLLRIVGTSDVATAQKEVTDIGKSKINNIWVRDKEVYFSEVNGLPKPKSGRLYLVHKNVLQAAKNRRDLRIPSEPIFNDAGEILGYQSIARI